MTLHHLFSGRLLWGSLLISSCAQISPVWGGQVLPSVSTHQTSALASEDFTKVQIAQAVTSAPSSASTVWASQSLARLMDQHDCSSQTGTEPFSIESGIGHINRYKIAAQLFSCLENWDQQTFDTQEQATLETLRSEFKLELVALGGHSVSDPVLTSANISRKVSRSILRTQLLSSQPSNSITNVPITTTEYSQSIKIASQGRLAMGVHYTDRALEAPRNLLGINAEASVGKIGLFGRYSTALGTQSTQSDHDADLLGDRSIQSWTAGIGIRDFIIQQSILTVSVSKSIQPNNLFQAAQTNYGAFYQFPLTERLTLSPSIVIMTHSEKTGATPDVQGALQASFSF